MAQPCRPLRIGVEMECLPSIHNARKILEEEQSAETYYPVFKRIQDSMNKYLRKKGYPEQVEVYDKSSLRARDYTGWVLKHDGSIAGKSHHDSTAPVEIVSPILFDRGKEENWNRPVRCIFQALDDADGVETNDTCGTHFHLSPESGAWTLEDLKQLSYCILYFEQAFEPLYWKSFKERGERKTYELHAPETEKPSRRIEYVKANWAQNRILKDYSFEQAVDAIWEKKTIWAVAKLMNAVKYDEDHQNDYRHANNQQANNPQAPAPADADRNYAWNFENLRTGNPKQTVEYRRPPGIQGANACINWGRLAATFVRAATNVKADADEVSDTMTRFPIPPRHVNVGELKEFLKPGLPPKTTFEDYFGDFFMGKLGNMKVDSLK